MSRKPIQFRILTLIWIIFASALVFGMIRHIRSASGNMFGQLLAAACFLGPLIWLFFRPNPFRGRAKVTQVRSEPAGPIENRLQQFMLNVTPVETPTDSNATTTVIPEVASGKSPRTAEQIASALRRIKQVDEGKEGANRSGS